MKFVHRAFWAAVASAVLVGGVSAQTIGGLGGSTTGSTGTTVGGGGGGTGGGGGMGGGGGGTGGSGAGASTSQTGTNSGVTSVTISAPSTYAQQPQSVATSNIIGKYYAAPLYQGRAGTTTTTNTAVVNPGGFGTAIYGTNGGAPQSTGGTSGRTSGVGGGGFGNTAGGNRAGGTQAGQAQVVAQGATSISYTATIKFATPTVTPEQMQAELRNTLSRSTGLSNAGGIQLTAGPNGAVTLRGRVTNEDEARLAEGLLRLTPGVRTVENELTFPKQ